MSEKNKKSSVGKTKAQPKKLSSDKKGEVEMEEKQESLDLQEVEETEETPEVVETQEALENPEVVETQEVVEVSEENTIIQDTTKMEATGRVYIRSEAGQSSSQLGILEVGEVVEVLETVNGWHKLENGFVMQGFLK